LMAFLRKIGALGVLLGLAASSVSGSSLDILTQTENGSQKAAATASLGASHKIASTQFERSGDSSLPVYSPPLVYEPEGSTVKKIRKELIKGETGRRIHDEPASPLTDNNEAVPQDSGKDLWWGAGGALAGAALGFLLGGPIGAVIGGLLGAIGGYFFGP